MHGDTDHWRGADRPLSSSVACSFAGPRGSTRVVRHLLHCPKMLSFLLAVCSTTIACSGTTSPGAGGADPVAINIQPPSVSMRAGQSLKLRATLVNAAGRPVSGGTVNWVSLDESVARISGEGTVVAVLFVPFLKVHDELYVLLGS